MYGIVSELNRLEFISIGNRRVRDVKEIVKQSFLCDHSGPTLAVTLPHQRLLLGMQCHRDLTYFGDIKYTLLKDLIPG